MEKLNINSMIKSNQDVLVPRFGLGVWKSKPKECYSAVISALKAGYRHIDTAAIYGNESEVGDAIRDSGIPRSEIFLVTKLWNADQGYDSALKAIDRSLSNLKTDYVDMYLIHFPVADKRKDSWRALQKIQSDKKTKAIGVSNYMIWHLEELINETEVLPAMNQVEYHPFLNNNELLSFCNSKGIILEAYSPLAHGQKLNDPKVSELAKKYNKSNAQILIRWSLQKGMVVIPKSANPERIVQNADVYDFEINAADMVSMESWDEGLRTCWDPTTVE
ncbi:aldo/keto reductase [Leptospira sp. GIMC2001]|uniref:aldo/keto reductase n=1 Tax=Leptospira sp. GIMC2001 TaxID=1513297 RepID=UPI003FA58DC8